MATWNTTFETSPADGDNISEGAGKIRELKVEVGDRGNREHTWAGTTAADGIHRAGSAKVYFTTATPTLQPDGVTALTTTDKGRLYFKSSTGMMLMAHNGTTFVSTGVTLSTSQTINGVKTFKSTSVFSSGITLYGAFSPKRIFTIGNIQEHQVYSGISPFVASGSTIPARGFVFEASAGGGQPAFYIGAIRRSTGCLKLVGMRLTMSNHVGGLSLTCQQLDSGGGVFADGAAKGVLIEW